MLKKSAAFILTLALLASAFTCAAFASPAVERTFRTEMNASVAYRDGVKYIALDVNITDITAPDGLSGIEFDVLFDGEALDPLWKTDEELNGSGGFPPQMITNWPVYTASDGSKLFAAEGLCKAYAITGSGVLNVNLIEDVTRSREAVYGDDRLSVRLYFTPVGGFEEGREYSFTIDGDYEETSKSRIPVKGVSGITGIPSAVYGYGSSASYTVTWADCGAFDLSDGAAGITPDGERGMLWLDGIYTAAEGEADIVSDSGENVNDGDAVMPGFSVRTSAGALTVAVKGDLNCDGAVSTLDFMLLKSALTGTAELSNLQSVIADINGDGALTTNDALRFRRFFSD